MLEKFQKIEKKVSGTVLEVKESNDSSPDDSDLNDIKKNQVVDAVSKDNTLALINFGDKTHELDFDVSNTAGNQTFTFDELSDHGKENQIDCDIKRILRTVKFWYLIFFVTVLYLVPYWHIMNMKSIGLQYHSENFIVSILIYAPLFAAVGRVVAGVLIERLGLKKTYLL